MKKIFYILGFCLIAGIVNASCEPKIGICDSSCDNMFNINLLTYNTSWSYYGPNGYRCEANPPISNPDLNIVNGSTILLWEVPNLPNNTNEDFAYIFFSGSPPNASQSIDIVCPSYGFYNSSITATDCICAFDDYCIGTEMWLPYFNFDDEFFAGPPTTTTLPPSPITGMAVVVNVLDQVPDVIQSFGGAVLAFITIVVFISVGGAVFLFVGLLTTKIRRI